MSLYDFRTVVTYDLIECVLVQQPRLAVPAQDLFLIAFSEIKLTMSRSFDSVPMLRVPSGSFMTTGLRNSSRS